jgi:hypothetical protein
MLVLVGCETSGVVREAFRLRGHQAFSCDLLPSDDGSPHHLQQDVIAVLRSKPWDLAILHPPCTYLASSGLHWNLRIPSRAEKTDKALQFVRDIVQASEHVPHVCIENPVGRISLVLGRASQIIQPHDYCEDASKRTCLWLRGLPLLQPTGFVKPRLVEQNGKLYPRWSNQTDSGQNKLPPSADRWKQRSRTYPGIAAAMADQWGAWAA